MAVLIAVLIMQAEEAAEYEDLLSGLQHLTSVVKENRRPLLPPQQHGTKRKTHALDLDHTFIRSTQHSLHKPKVKVWNSSIWFVSPAADQLHAIKMLVMQWVPTSQIMCVLSRCSTPQQAIECSLVGSDTEVELQVIQAAAGMNRVRLALGQHG